MVLLPPLYEIHHKSTKAYRKTLQSTGNAGTRHESLPKEKRQPNTNGEAFVARIVYPI